MNKQLLIVLLAVCLVSTHAFVKRDAALPTVEDLKAQLEIAKTKLEELISKVTEDTNKNVNADTIKDNFNNLIDVASKAIEAFKPTTEAPAA